MFLAKWQLMISIYNHFDNKTKKLCIFRAQGVNLAYQVFQDQMVLLEIQEILDNLVLKVTLVLLAML